MNVKDHNNIKNTKVDCNLCSLQNICLPKAISKKDVSKLDDLIERKSPLKKGDLVFNQDQKFKSLYVVRSGSIKTFATSANGAEQIMGVHLPGEILGIAAFSSGKYRCSAKALEATSLCEVPFNDIEQLGKKIPGLHHQMLNLMSKEVCNEHTTILFLGKKTAQERLATYLVSISLRFERRGFSPYEFQLNLSRSDVANYLNLAVETISRMFTQFQKDKIISCNKKTIQVLDMDKLNQLAGLSNDNCL